MLLWEGKINIWFVKNYNEIAFNLKIDVILVSQGPVDHISPNALLFSSEYKIQFPWLYIV